LRMREWQDLNRQLHRQVVGQGKRVNHADAEYAEIHRALLSGFVDQIGFKQEQSEYLGPRNTKFHIFPGSGLHGAGPKWLLASELVETGKLYARKVARIEPEWIEKAAAHLVTREYFSPHWQARSGKVGGYEKVSLYGLTVIPKRRINYGKVDAKTARQLFISEGLVQGNYPHEHKFLSDNTALVESIHALENRARRRDLLVDEKHISRFYDEKLPAEIYDAHGLEKWLKQADQQALTLTRDALLAKDPQDVTENLYPSTLVIQGVPLPLEYEFTPGDTLDGITLAAPLDLINQIEQTRLDWLVPGYLTEKITALIKSLPKSLRRNFVPAPDFAQACVQALAFGEGDLLQAVAKQLQRMTGIEVPADAWDVAAIPDHLNMKVRLVDESNTTLATDHVVERLQQKYGARANRLFSRLASGEWPAGEATDWTFPDMPDSVTVTSSGQKVVAFPAIAARGDHVETVLVDTAARAAKTTEEGLLCLFSIKLKKELRYVRRNLPNI
ncbi:MAG: DUF3418 domain-containing protein, partial [Gammaproteobacteria bacterium]|nr:DUF3418 domain-containing protein [Gammaproteobacteria bacterium]